MVSDGLFRFACYVAICDLKFGPSYASVSAERIFNQVTQLGGDLPARLKRDGTGSWELAAFRGAGMSAKANDALAVIRITVQESEAAYAQRSATWTACCRPRTSRAPMPSSSVGRPRPYPSGFCQRRACTSCSPARRLSGAAPGHRGLCAAAMREYEWYTNLDAEDCAMPGSFAVFALGCASAARPLVLDYLAWRTASINPCMPLCRRLSRRPWLHPGGDRVPAGLRRQYPASAAPQDLRGAIANADSLGWLLEARRRVAGDAPSSIAALRANLLGERVDEAAFRAARHAIWGEQADKDRGGQVIRGARGAARHGDIR